MIDTGRTINFVQTDYAHYMSEMNHDVDSLYYLTDTRQLFLGSIQFTHPFVSMSGSPDENNLNPSDYINTLYYDTDDNKLYTSNGSMWTLVDVTAYLNTNVIPSSYIESLFTNSSQSSSSPLSGLV